MIRLSPALTALTIKVITSSYSLLSLQNWKMILLFKLRKQIYIMFISYVLKCSVIRIGLYQMPNPTQSPCITYYYRNQIRIYSLSLTH